MTRQDTSAARPSCAREAPRTRPRTAQNRAPWALSALCLFLLGGCATTVSWKFNAVSRAAASTTGRSEDVDEAACYRALRDADVSFAKVAAARAGGVEYPLRLTGDLGGVEILGRGKNEATSYLDCRLARALLGWSPILRAAGVTAIEHYSMYRENARVAGTTKRSGHASGLAIDAARFQLEDGSFISVLDDWRDQTRGADPCAARAGEAAPARLMRQIVCEAAAQGLFQTIITPHYNQAHHNHVHLEIAELGRGTWIR